MSGWPFHLLLPLLGGLVYVVAVLLLKRAADLGADVWRTSRILNLTSALFFLPLLALGGKIPPAQLWWQPAIVALLFVGGQVFTLLALQRGDVSIATPVLGLKIVIVAVLVAVILGESIKANLWMAALLSSAAIGLLNASGGRSRHHHVGTTIVLSMAAAGAYALFDVLVQKWAALWGAGRLLPVMMIFVAGYSFAVRPYGEAADKRARAGRVKIPPAARPWIAAGAICFAIQGLLIVSAIGVYGQAAVANVLYSSRGLWSVVAVWGIGHWFVNREQHLGPRVLAWRLCGAAMLMLAILIVLFDRS
jgi:uncharacterized membrane protein